MDTKKKNMLELALIGLAGVFIGGTLVVFLTNAIPKMMKNLMAGMMENMQAQMAAAGCKPEEI